VQTLVMIATAPVQGDGPRLRLDVKFVEGMRAHVAQWPGPVRCILWAGAGAIPFGAEYDRADLGFDLVILPEGGALTADLFAGAAAVFAAADSAEVLGIAPMVRAAGAKLVFSVEYTLETRLQIVRLDASRNWPRRLWSMLWNIRQERRRRAALRAADGVQVNGYPALAGARALNPKTMLYLDGRMRADMMATPPEMATRAARLRAGEGLRLVHSGRLEPMKGAQDLLPVMAALRAQGVKASLDIFGTGSLRDQIAQGAQGFGGAVRLHDPVDFETVLVPWCRANADLFLSCHRQSDPSCTYIEAMGCGLAVAGYDNRMWGEMARVSGGGAVAPLGNRKALADRIAAWDQDRQALIKAGETALHFARSHDFDSQFGARMAHLRAVSGVSDA
jgi:colanic acid/amylovoran biosynthesis glycosyltransferase